MTPCDRCVRRAWLLGRLAGHLEPARARIAEVLGLGDEELIAAVGGMHREALMREWSSIDVEQRRRQYSAAGIVGLCRCDPRFPAGLMDLSAPPAVLHIARDEATFLRALANPVVAIVGARRASRYGLEVARSLARGLASAGVTVISGMAYGIDSAAHDGALAAGATLAAGRRSPCCPPAPNGHTRLAGGRSIAGSSPVAVPSRSSRPAPRCAGGCSRRATGSRRRLRR